MSNGMYNALSCITFFALTALVIVITRLLIKPICVGITKRERAGKPINKIGLGIGLSLLVLLYVVILGLIFIHLMPWLLAELHWDF